jgi:hypothetical protein
LLDSLAGHYTAWAVNAREGEYRLPRDDEVKLQCMNKRASAALDGVNTKSKATSDSSQRCVFFNHLYKHASIEQVGVGLVARTRWWLTAVSAAACARRWTVAPA